MTSQPKVVLIVLDGWGYNPNPEGNAIAAANKPVYDYIWNNYPHTLLTACGEAVGLPWGEIGSSEVGHLTIGSGQVVYQDLPRVTSAIQDGSFFQNKIISEALHHAKQQNSALHLCGLLSSGGVHSHIYHLESILKLVKSQNFNRPIYIHAFTDGRDTAPSSASMFFEKIDAFINELKVDAKVVSISGRYFAMDRDNHWERTLAAYDNLVEGKGQEFTSSLEAIDYSYKNNVTDEFIKPAVILQSPAQSFLNKIFGSKSKPIDATKPVGTIEDNDSVLFFNFRPDRMRQIVELFCFPRQDMPSKVMRQNLYLATLTEYNENLPVHVAFPPERVKNTLAKILSERHYTQLHVAETEKYAHVTYFFNGGNPTPNEGEKWNLIPSPKVPTYDLQPEMSCAGVAEYVIKANSQTPYDFILINFANADMVGHTGKVDAATKAVEAIDAAVGQLIQAFPNTYFLFTGDHGNAEAMLNPQTGGKNTKHSINPVPFIIVHPSLKLAAPQSANLQATGILADITPTVLSIFGIDPYPEMTGYNLLESFSPTYRAAIDVEQTLGGSNQTK